MIPKFRAWDKEEKRMSYGKIEYYDDSFGVRFDHFCVGADFGVEFMQSTGLKDKNGVEIFEGDVLGLITTRALGYHSTGILIKKEVNFGEFWVEDDTLYQFYGFYLDENLSIEYFLGKGAIVIGNIYENPELLERTNEN